MTLFTKLKPKPKHTASATVLLLDVSGSMDASVEVEEGASQRRIEVLFKAVRETPECNGLKAFTFSYDCHPLEVIPSESEALNYKAHGTTDMAGAFTTIKNHGYFNAILVTDGEPDSERDALQAAYGLRLGIIYIGNPPVPPFLQRLAEATNGTFQLADLRDIRQLENSLAKALPAPESDSEGTIIL